MDHGLHPFALLHLQNIHDIGALGGLAALGDLVALLAVHLAGVREEKDVVVGGGGEHIHHIVLLTGGDTLAALSALTLGGIFADGGALDVSGRGESEHALLLFDQILDVDLVLHILDLGQAVVAEFIGDGLQFFLQNLAHQRIVGQNALIVGDLLFQLLIFLFQLFPVEALQSLQAHIQNGLRLHIVQGEALASGAAWHRRKRCG